MGIRSDGSDIMRFMDEKHRNGSHLARQVADEICDPGNVREGRNVVAGGDTDQDDLLKILLIEDSCDDALLIERYLRNHGLDIEIRRAYENDDIHDAFSGGGDWSVVLSDYHLPCLNALDVLRTVRTYAPDIPFLIVSGKIGESTAVEAMRAGVNDYVMKDNLARLGPAIQREVRDAGVRRQRCWLELESKRLAISNQLLIDSTSEGICSLDLDGNLKFVNSAAREMLKLESRDYVGISLHSIVHSNPSVCETKPEDCSVNLGFAATRGLSAEAATFWTSEEEHFPVEFTVNPMIENYEHVGNVVTFHDVTERKLAEEKIRIAQEKYKAIFDNAIEGMYQSTSDGGLIAVNPALSRMLGYSSREELLDSARKRNFSLYSNSEDIRDLIREVAKQGSVAEHEMQLLCKDGAIIWASLSVSVVRDSDGKIVGYQGMVENITNRRSTENSLRRTLDILLALREAGQILGSTLETEQIGTKLLGIMRSVSGLDTTIINIEDEGGEIHIWRAAGIEALWPKARYEWAAEFARRRALETGEYQTFEITEPEPGKRVLLGLCLPMKVRDKVVGVLEAYGSGSIRDNDLAEMLSSLANQAATALENARLYEELAKRENRLASLVGKLFEVQEEERRRVAYEVHDGLAQVAAAAHQHLQAYVRFHTDNPADGRAILEEALRLLQQTVGEARRVIANLRPMALDDLGLQAALRREVEILESRGWKIVYESRLDRDERLPFEIETAIFRIAQQAVANISKHSGTTEGHIILQKNENRICLRVRDWGCGFDTSSPSVGTGPGERVGIPSMQERVMLLGGEFNVNSTPGEGTIVEVEIPLKNQPAEVI